jgi:hypothetical protein
VKDAGTVVAEILRAALEKQRTECKWLSSVVVEQGHSPLAPQGLQHMSAEGLVEAAEAIDETFCEIVDEFLEAIKLPRASRHFGPLKSLARVRAKMTKCEGQLCVFDMNRVEIVCKDRHELSMAVTNITLIGHIARIKNKFLGDWENPDQPPCVFYNLELNKSKFPETFRHLLADRTRWIVEVQITMPEFLEIKHQCHAVYEISRVVDFPRRCPVCQGFAPRRN